MKNQAIKQIVPLAEEKNEKILKLYFCSPGFYLVQFKEYICVYSLFFNCFLKPFDLDEFLRIYIVDEKKLVLQLKEKENSWVIFDFKKSNWLMNQKEIMVFENLDKAIKFARSF